MRYKTFGRKTGLRVSEYALGTANFSTSRLALEWKPPVRYSMPLLLRVVRRSTCPISTKTDRQKLSSVSCSAKTEATTW